MFGADGRGAFGRRWSAMNRLGATPRRYRSRRKPLREGTCHATSYPTRERGVPTPALAGIAVGANALVILQGAFVRATGSGAGCGRHWPLCNGEVVPLAGGAHTAIEFAHRLLSLVVLILGAWLFARGWRERRQRPGLFAFTVAATAFLAIEAALGAATVLGGLTGDDRALARSLMVATHLVNSLLLVGALVGVWLYARPRPPAWPLRLRHQGALGAVLAIGMVGMLFLMFTGGIAAMGNTTFPAASLAEGLAADLSPDAHPLARLRILHPLIAITVGVYLFLSLGTAWWIKPVREARGLAQVLLGVYGLQLAVGTLNLTLSAPLALQLLHLSLAVVAFASLEGAWPSALAARPVPEGRGHRGRRPLGAGSR
jgi:heme a synthase